MSGLHVFISSAIEFCSAKSNGSRSQKEVIELLKTQDISTHSEFRYSIARDVTQYIFQNYGNVIKDVRLYGSTMEYTAGKYSDIDILIRTERQGFEIYENLKMLDKILVSEYFNLIEEDFDQYMYLLDIHIIDDNLRNQSNPSKAYLLQILQNESVAI
jgi:predicted nucleotidyltransferase